VLLGIMLILAVLVVLGNLLADLAYGWADPRIQYR
jgi:ABC-type dipeptide/oligopeptide/nickel transport system permease component